MPLTGSTRPATARVCALALALAAGAAASQAHAQVAESVLVTPAYPDGYAQYQQRGVNEQGEGDWQAQGMRVGSFNLYPRALTRVAATSNVFLSSVRSVAATYVVVSPSIQAYSNWKRHSLALTADANLSRYLGQPRRNETAWTLESEGQLDITRSLSVSATANATQIALNRFSGDLTIDAASVAIIRQNKLALSSQYRAGLVRLLANAEYFDLDYRRILLADGTQSDQSARNHSVIRLSSQAEYSPSTDITLFAQAALVRFDYGTPLVPSISTTDSSGIRGLVGLRWEVQGLGRFSVAGGYSHHTYSVSSARRVDRPSVEARVELFPSPLTTVRLDVADRTIDARLIDVTPLRQQSAAVSAYHALYRNVTLSANAAMIRQRYLFSSQVSRIGNFGLNARVLVSRNWVLGAQFSYSTRQSSSTTSNYRLQEASGGISATFKL